MIIFVCGYEILGSCSNHECVGVESGCPLWGLECDWRCRNNSFRISFGDYSPGFLYWKVRFLFFKFGFSNVLKKYSLKNLFFFKRFFNGK